MPPTLADLFLFFEAQKRRYLPRYVLVLPFCFFMTPHSVRAQQEPLYTQYMFSKLLYNPACAGANGHLTANILHRKQWIGFDGAPSTQAFMIHSPLRKENIGAGLSILRDQNGPVETYDLYTSYAYGFLLTYDLRLSIGLQGGFTNWHADWLHINLEDNVDPVYQQNISIWRPNFGAGLYLSNKKFYAGMGIPRLLEHRLDRSAKDQGGVYGFTYRHFYANAGMAIPIGAGSMIFRPSAMLRTAGWISGVSQARSPASLDLDASVFLEETLWLGAAFRTSFSKKYNSVESLDIRTAWYFRNGVRMGVTYDILLNRLRKSSAGSLEIMLGYEFDIKVNKVASPRYF